MSARIIRSVAQLPPHLPDGAVVTVTEVDRLTVKEHLAIERAVDMFGNCWIITEDELNKKIDHVAVHRATKTFYGEVTVPKMSREERGRRLRELIENRRTAFWENLKQGFDQFAREYHVVMDWSNGADETCMLLVGTLDGTTTIEACGHANTLPGALRALANDIEKKGLPL